MSIALRHITLAYGRRILLRDVSASVPPGSLTALIGRNGTGKSTLLRAVAGLGAAASGGIELCGKPLAALTPLQRASTVSFVTATSWPVRSGWSAWRLSPAKRWTACPTANASAS